MTDTNYLQKLRTWRQEMDDRLRAPDGWLTLVGLHWLDEGTNYLGTGPNNDLVLPPGTAPEHIGVLERKSNDVLLKVDPKSDVLIEGKLVEEEFLLKPDTSGEPTMVTVGELVFFLVVRGERVGIRVKQENHANRLSFNGRVWYPPSPPWRVAASIHPYDPPKPMPIENVLGDSEDSDIDARLEFSLNGSQYNLDAFLLEDGRYYILFKDSSSGVSTYPSGRYLVTEKAQENQVVIDFNKAYNPPCAFTDYATCPLPPAQNLLSVAVQAGEKYRHLSNT